MERLKNLALVRWANVHPRIAAWIVLSAGMLILLVIEAQNVGLLVGQWIALSVAVVLVAGVCIWIISWEDDDDEAAEAKPETVTEPVIPETPVAAVSETPPQADAAPTS